ncbi:PREDICTED: protein HGH1 homolog isoform X1 [Drosophila arizonae]|uniref:Protein HGH1 homolog n=2 Tax=Drosophila arizonae TaxID=7263 RepID=A0ABM1NM48_DROAR|nr:PREDICTED: protein HGH1 homolog isoform X1 [Drosophila arizonae]
METVKELVQFMQPNQRLDLKAVALTHVLSLTGSTEGKDAILSLDDMLMAIFGLTLDANATVAKDAVLSLINLTAEEAGAFKVFQLAQQVQPRFAIVDVAAKQISDEQAELADAWSMVLSNLTRVESLVPAILDTLEPTLLQLAKAFAKLDYNKKKCKLHYLASIFCNLTQVSRGREICCQPKYQLLQKLLPFASFEESVVRRGGTIGIIKNICFDVVYHDIILNEQDDILVAILQPLCGPEEFSDEDNEKLPIELQYLPESKTRESDPDLRKMLLECLLQLCATRRCREVLRAKGVYEILREYHKWEAKVGRDSECLLACENVVDILLKKEEEIGLDNYHSVEVSAEQADKFAQDDAAYVKTLLD